MVFLGGRVGGVIWRFWSSEKERKGDGEICKCKRGDEHEIWCRVDDLSITLQ